MMAWTGIRPAAAITRTAGYVDGALQMQYTASGSKKFEVGSAGGYAPVTVNVTGGTGKITVKAVNGGTDTPPAYWKVIALIDEMIPHFGPP